MVSIAQYSRQQFSMGRISASVVILYLAKQRLVQIKANFALDLFGSLALCRPGSAYYTANGIVV